MSEKYGPTINDCAKTQKPIKTTWKQQVLLTYPKTCIRQIRAEAEIRSALHLRNHRVLPPVCIVVLLAQFTLYL